MGASNLLREVDHLESLQIQLKALRERDDAARARELVKLRRELSLQVGRISIEARAFFSPATHLEVVQEFGEMHSALLSKMALHQAEWPAVNLTKANAEYDSSAKSVDTAITSLVDWLRRKSRGAHAPHLR